MRVESAAQPFYPPERAKTDPAQAQPAAPETERVPRSTKPQQAALPDGWMQDFLTQLQGQYQSVNITVAELDWEGLRDYAATCGSGAHLVLSKDFLSRMEQSPEAFQRGKDLLESVLGQLSRQVGGEGSQGAYVTEESLVFWAAEPTPESPPNAWEQAAEETKSLLRLMEEAAKRAKELREKFQVKVGDSVYHARAEAAYRLARATTVSGVKGAVSMARRNICTLKLALSMGSDKDRDKIRAAIADLERVAGQGPKKIRALDEEQQMRSRQKRAEQEQARRRALQIKQELQRRQAVRRAKEYAQIAEIGRSHQLNRDWERRQPQLTVEQTAVVMPDAAVPTTGTNTFAAADVCLSPAIAIEL